MNNGVKKIFKYCLVLIILLSLFLFIKLFSLDFKNDKNLINIDDLSEEFMQNYFEEIKQVNEGENKDNLLIVTSKNKLKNNYNAINVIEAPNNQYILEYDSKDKKEKALLELNNDKSIISAEENIIYTVDDTGYNSWGVEALSLDYAREIADASDLNPVTVAIIDTGCDVELANKYYDGKISETYNALNSSATKMTDERGHGTHVLGTIAESTPSNVKLLPIKVSTTDSMSNTAIIAAINYITRYEKADVINMSFGAETYSASLDQAIEAAKQKNIISVAAAGNNNSFASHYPAALDNTISIASVDSTLNKSVFSNYGSTITFTAPGTKIKSIMSKDSSISMRNNNADLDDDHETISGTSMATPHAVSAVAILKSYKKDLTMDNVIELLKKHAIDLGNEGWDMYYGNGLISFKDAQFCDGENCDEYGVFKEISENEIVKIEVPEVTLTPYNYGSIYNLFNTDIKIYHNEEEYISKKLWELEELEINNYDPYKEEEQEIEISYKNLITNVTIPSKLNYESGWEYNKLDENNIELTLYKDNNQGIKKLYIPEKIDEYNVVALASNDTQTSKVFSNSNDYDLFEEIVLPNTLTRLGNSSLYDTNAKKIISKSDSVSVDEYALMNADNLIEFDGIISELGVHAFDGNKLIDNITLANTITTISDYAFNECNNLQNINLPSSLESIGDFAFANNNRLREIILPNGLKTIGESSFYMTAIQDLITPESLQEIGNNAFEKTNIRNLSISKNVTSIGEDAFLESNAMETIEVQSENTVYDSRNNCNCLIETETNTILKGSQSLKFPNTVKIIGKRFFYKDLRFAALTIPSNVIKIEDEAFYGCKNLDKITIGKNVKTIGTNAFSSNTTLYTYKDAYAKTYASTNKISYVTKDPTNIIVNTSKNNYIAFDKVNSEDIASVFLEYAFGTRIDESTYNEQTRLKNVTDYQINYMNNNDSFRYGDTHYIIKGTNEYSISYQKQVNVTVEQATPEYTIPNDLTVDLGKTLAEVILPNGFLWDDENIVLNEEGTFKFKAKYVPSDTKNYKTIENIEIPVYVKSTKTIVTPTIYISDKIYDGTTNLPLDNVIINDLNNVEYIIESINLSSMNAGDTTAIIKLKISEESFKKYSFDNAKQEKEFIVNVKILPLEIQKPTLKETKYIYNSFEQEILIDNYDEKTMNISGNKRTNAGEQNVVISLKNTNYIWSDKSNSDIIFKFKIEKANFDFSDLSEDVNVKYDGNFHTIKVKFNIDENTKILYMDENGQYILEEVPKYKNSGKYITKYKVYIDNNYNEYYGEKTLQITSNEIINKTMDYEGVYDGKYHSINLKIDLPNYSVKYSLDGKNYNLESIPKFKDIGDHNIYYKVISDGYEDLIASNKVRIYGVKGFDKSITVKDNILLVEHNNFSKIKDNILTYSKSSLYKHYNKNNILIDSDKVSTGDIIKINLNNLYNYEYKLAILGEVSGDGKINYLDYVNVYNHIYKTKHPNSNKKILNDEYLLAADISKDGKINYLDYVNIYNKIKELKGGN